MSARVCVIFESRNSHLNIVMSRDGSVMQCRCTAEHSAGTRNISMNVVCALVSRTSIPIVVYDSEFVTIQMKTMLTASASLGLQCLCRPPRTSLPSIHFVRYVARPMCNDSHANARPSIAQMI